MIPEYFTKPRLTPAAADEGQFDPATQTIWGISPLLSFVPFITLATYDGKHG